ncbi:MAG TPA: NAD-dependent epimerase/dehydratase family protein [Terrimesophilobacter sp.]|nr:NAD-dependent epimerase/dehydratase family protein [Terrimesophilobacter sp.]
MRCLVTGVAGFVGSTLAGRLLESGHDVVGIDSLTDYYAVGLKRANLRTLASDRFRFVDDDLLDADLDELLTDIDVVFHLAGQPGVRRSWGSEFNRYLRDNVEATQRLLEAAMRLPGLQRLVFSSSSSIYGDAERYPTLESDGPRPLSPYGVTKLAAEHLCSLYAANYGTPTVSLRYFTVYGPRQRPDMAFTRFMRAALTGEEITVYGDGEQVRDFTYVDDVVEANILAATSAVEPGAVFNISGGGSTSVNAVLESIERLAGARLRIKRLPPAAGDVRRTGGSSELAREALGWMPRVDMEAGISRQWAWLATGPTEGP